jgi:raffinose/stachyose/melibiose transport system substrate-binding protein
MREQGENVGPDSEVSFQKDFAEVMDRQYQLYSYMQEGYRGRTYDDGNAAFARGESAMLLQGIWATNPIKQVNPESLLVSGVDVVFTLGKDNPKHDAAMRFIEYVFQPDVIERFAASQNMVPSVEGAELSDDPALQSVRPYFEDQRITGFIDHQIPPSIPLIPTDQQFLFDGDAEAALKTLDSEWAKVAARTIPVTEE